MLRRVLAISCVLSVAILAIAGTWTSKNFLYKPSLGARGEGEKNTFDSGLDRVDARLAKEIWVGDPGYGTTLQNAITGIGGNQAILRIPAGTWSINANFTIPANVTLKPERGAILSLASGVTLTINGGLDAGLQQIFSWSGTGKVIFGAATKEVYPQWWGAKGDGVNDDTGACNSAHSALPLDSGWGGPHKPAGTVRYVAGRYKITSPIILGANTRVIGDGPLSTTIYNSTTNQDSFQTDHTTQNSALNITVRDLSIQGSTSATAGAAISLDDTLGGGSSFILENITILGHYNGVYFKDAVVAALKKVRVDMAANDGFNQAGTMNAVTLTSCYANHNSRHGFYVKPTGSSFIACAADTNSLNGYHLYSSSISDASTAASFQGCSSESNGNYNFYASAARKLNITSFWGYSPAGHDGIHLDGGSYITLASCWAAGTSGYGLYLGVELYGSTGIIGLVQTTNDFSGGTGGVYTHASTQSATAMTGYSITCLGGGSQTVVHLQPRISDANYQLELRSNYNASKDVELVAGASGTNVFSYGSAFARLALGKNTGTIGIGYVDSAAMPTYSDGIARLLVVGGTSLVGIRNDSPSAALDISADKIRLRTAKTPASANDTGNTGDICWDANYLYVCVAPNTWKRVALSTW